MKIEQCFVYIWRTFVVQFMFPLMSLQFVNFVQKKTFYKTLLKFVVDTCISVRAFIFSTLCDLLGTPCPIETLQERV
jgi:hypothetical protein